MRRCVARGERGGRQPCEHTKRRHARPLCSSCTHPFLHNPCAQKVHTMVFGRPVGAGSSGFGICSGRRKCRKVHSVKQGNRRARRLRTIPLYAALPQSRTAVLMCPVDPWWPETKISRPYVLLLLFYLSNQPALSLQYRYHDSCCEPHTSKHGTWLEVAIDRFVGFVSRCSSLHTHSNFLV